MESAFERLCVAIGYPKEEVQLDGDAHILIVDGSEIRIEELANRLIFRFRLIHVDEDGQEELTSRLAEYAAGRLLREEAVLSWDESKRELFIWQAASADASSRNLRQIFELFLTSCDWWKSRVEDEAAREKAPALREMFIRP